MMKRFSLVCTAALVGFSLSAQSPAVEAGLDHLKLKMQAWQLQPGDVSEMRVTDQYTSTHNNVTHIYWIQQYRGIEVDRATYNVNLKNGEVLYAGERLVRNLAEKIEHTSPVVSAEAAITKAFDHLGAVVRSPLARKSEKARYHYLFEKGTHSHVDMDVRMIYARQENGTYRLAWEVTAEPMGGHDLWKVRVDASSGKIVGKIKLTAHCTFTEDYLGRADDCTDVRLNPSLESNMPLLSSDGAQYNVIEIPYESPKFSDRAMVENPADPDASPYGWHDLDGADGVDTTITWGNNVRAFIDRDGDYTFNEPATSGGANLIFDFPYDPMTEPIDHQDAAVTNLFYMNNIMHDFTYHYGFDEAAGNFQNSNLTGQGAGNDYVLAHAQFGAGTADPPLSNATFGTPTDGGSGRMRMYVWEGAGANELLRVESPPEVGGPIETETTNAWGAAITSEPVTGEVVTVDGSGTATPSCDVGAPSRGCRGVVNDLTGKIALIDRGDCEFGCKALNAQNAGAIGFIICNFDETLVLMGAGAVGDQVTIPGVFIRSSDCQKIKVYADNGLVVSLVNESAGIGPARRSGSLDNSVIAHEYGHGISNRLTGGPGRADCLNNYDHDNNDTFEDGEQMGEGWSDFFALVTTVQPGDDGTLPRGVASFASGRPTLGGRPYPYTTDLNVNPHTYDDIAFSSVPHGIGAVWCAMLWDLYWTLTDAYGFDPDLYHGTGGNNLAIQLVMDGMKFQTCNPGLVDGRDAILAADVALTGGENQKLIWEVFARRGLGYSAEQGDEAFRLDGKESFDVSPYVIKELKVLKEMTPYIDPGDPVTVTVMAVNHKAEDAIGVSLTDAIPAGTTVDMGSLPAEASVQGEMVSFEIGNMAPDDTVSFTYTLLTSTEIFSKRLFYDNMENGDFNWDLIFVEDAPYFWTLQTFLANSGTTAWAAQNIDTTSDYSLITGTPLLVTGDQPMLSFYHNYQTERFFDACLLQVSDDDGTSWKSIDEEHVVRGDYEGKIQYNLFAVPNIKGWYGTSDEWVNTMVDLSAYAGEEIQLRFRFGSDGNTSVVGWFVDDVEIMEAINYNSSACISSTEGDAACSEAPRMGTIVSTNEISSLDDGPYTHFETAVYPNPARQVINVDIASPVSQEAIVRMINATGGEVWHERAFVNGVYRTQINARALPQGFYFVHIACGGEQVVEKVVVH